MIAHSDPISLDFGPLQASGAKAPSVGGESSTNPPMFGGKRILLVEDQELLRTSVRMMLELDGHRVTEASNGAEALKSFVIGEFDLVVTDFEMPIMKGNELAAGIKLLAPSLPILMVTASERARRDAENPVDALLNKPFTVTDLHGAVGKLLSARPEPAQPSSIRSLESFSVSLAPEREIALLQA